MIFIRHTGEIKPLITVWFEKSIKKKEIPYYNYDDFNNIKEIGSGATATVYAASMKKTKKPFAFKKFFATLSMNEVINEVF